VPSGVRAAAIAIVLIGCTRVSDESRFEPVAEEIAIMRTVPEAGASEVEPTVQIDLCWSGLLDPRSVGDLDAFITSGAQFVDTRVAVQLWPWRPPANASGAEPSEAPWCSGSVLSVTPKAELVGGVQYRMQLQDNAVGWAGEQIATDRAGWIDDGAGGSLYLVEFTVAEDPPMPPEEPPADDPVLLSDLFAPGGPFDPARGLCSCHAGGDELAQSLLDLSTPETAFEDLVLPPRLRDTGFAMVTPRIPSESFLLHKLLRDPDGSAIHGVLGDAMPQGDAPLPHADYVALARWIEDGALP
jgi:hypothetical protein